MASAAVLGATIAAAAGLASGSQGTADGQGEDCGWGTEVWPELVVGRVPTSCMLGGGCGTEEFPEVRNCIACAY